MQNDKRHRCAPGMNRERERETAIREREGERERERSFHVNPFLWRGWLFFISLNFVVPFVVMETRSKEVDASLGGFLFIFF